MEKSPIFRFRPGRVIEIEHTSGRFGYLIAHFKKPREGTFFALVTRTFDSPLHENHLKLLLNEPKTTVWLNTYKLLGTKDSLTFRIKGILPEYVGSQPVFWFGEVEHFLTIKHPDGTQETRTTTLSEREWEEEMERQGIIHSVLWLPRCIGDFLFNGVPLRWTAHKKF